MPFNNEPTSKIAHAEFIENPDIESLVENSNYLKEPTLESSEQISKEFTNVLDLPPTAQALPTYIHVSDGSPYEASLDNRYPSTKVGYIKVSSLVINLPKYQEISKGIPSRRYIDPIAVNELEEKVKAISFALPSANLRYRGATTVADGFRLRLFEQLSSTKTFLPNAGTMLDTLFRLASFSTSHQNISHGTRVDNKAVVFVAKCPSCNFTPGEHSLGGHGFAIWEDEQVAQCPECNADVFPSDILRLHEPITDYNGLAGGLSRIMNVAEYLLLAHLIVDCMKSDYKQVLSDTGFFVDGPLAFFGQPAWLSRPMLHLISSANSELAKLNSPPLIMIGIQKQGSLADHANMIGRYLPRDCVRMVDDEYRNRNIAPVKAGSNFGDETYFGQDFIYNSPKGNTFVLALPYFSGNKRINNFKQEKSRIENYPDLKRVLKIVSLFESDLYGGSLIPIIIAHRHASISRVPGGKILDIASQVGLEKGILQSIPPAKTSS